MDSGRNDGWLTAIGLVETYQTGDFEGHRALAEGIDSAERAADVLGALVRIAARNTTALELDARRNLVLHACM